DAADDEQVMGVPPTTIDVLIRNDGPVTNSLASAGVGELTRGFGEERNAIHQAASFSQGHEPSRQLSSSGTMLKALSFSEPNVWRLPDPEGAWPFSYPTKFHV